MTRHRSDPNRVELRVICYRQQASCPARAGLVSVERQGRGRYFRLAGPSVAEALEALARISPPEPIRSLRQGTRAYALRRARTCYNHLAGRLGVALMSAMLDQRLLLGGDGYHRLEHGDPARLSTPGTDLAYRLTPRGRETLAAFGLDLATVSRKKPMIRYSGGTILIKSTPYCPFSWAWSR